MIFILCKSSVWAWTTDLDTLNDGDADASRPMESGFRQSCLRRLAVPQILLVVMALLSYHVQIITRLSSAYPLWYMWMFASTTRSLEHRTMKDAHSVEPEAVVRWMVIYAMVQGTLFASFLPPA
jgi:GPI mannosyltransferase 2